MNLPPGIIRGSREHALNLFFLGWINRYGEKALVLRDHLAQAWSSHPGIIDPRRIMFDQSRKVLEEIIPLADSEPERIDQWLACRQILLESYGGDPRNIFLTHEGDRENLIQALDDFPGIGRKIAQLIGVWFQEVRWPGNSSCRDVWKQVKLIPLFPTDMWIARLFVQSQIISSWRRDSRDKIILEICEFTCGLCARHRLSHIDLAQGFWHIGALICDRRPKGERQKQRADMHCLSECPLHDHCTIFIQNRWNNYLNGRVGADDTIVRCSEQNLFAPGRI